MNAHSSTAIGTTAVSLGGGIYKFSGAVTLNSTQGSGNTPTTANRRDRHLYVTRRSGHASRP